MNLCVRLRYIDEKIAFLVANPLAFVYKRRLQRPGKAEEQ
jgi:hypothetical protein